MPQITKFMNTEKSDNTEIETKRSLFDKLKNPKIWLVVGTGLMAALKVLLDASPAKPSETKKNNDA